MSLLTRGLRLAGRLDRSFGWDGQELIDSGACLPGAPLPDMLHGAAAFATVDTHGHSRFLRDPLGLNKLFWSTSDAGDLIVAARPAHLVRAGCPFGRIRAFPPGMLVDLDRQHRTLIARPLRHAVPPTPSAAGPDSLERLAREIRAILHRYCAGLAAVYGDARIFVCVSGGLDSAGVAVLARDHFRDVVAVSFDISRDGKPASEDRRTAERLARDLGLPFFAVTVTEDELLDTLDAVLVEAIDWRDFNVHAGLVNAAMARAIADAFDVRSALVMTGDLMNEFLADYAPESYGGRSYYRLPRIPLPKLRSFLVRGLESSHREVGPFERWGLPVVQPYAAAAHLYLGVPAAILATPRRKPELTRLVFADRIPGYVYSRPKTRAQVGDSQTGRGVLGVCVDRGLDQGWLRQRFATLHDVSDVRALDSFIRCGRYRSGVPVSQEKTE